jgi:uncharacterized protein involved in exopolysaccharide biosynthesis/protein involved in polysaccharide export with SLBB domain
MKENCLNSAKPQVRSQAVAPMIDLKQLWALAFINWHWIVASVISCVLLALLYLWFTPTTVSVTGKMEIIDKSKKGNGLSAGMAMLNSLPMGLGSALGGSLGGSAGIESEKEILISNSLVTNVVKDLSLFTEYRLSEWGRKTLLYQDQPVNVSLDPAHVEWLDAELPLYFHQIKLTITKDNKGYTVETMLKENKEKTYLPDQTFSSLPATIKTDAGVLTLTENTMLTKRQSEKFQDGYTLKVTITPPCDIAEEFIKYLTVEPPTKKVTNILNITLVDENVMRGIDFVNHLVEVYNQRANDDKNEEALKTDEFVNARLAKVDAELGSSDADWEKYKKRFQITEPSVDAQEVMTKKSVYETQLVEIGTQLQLHDYLNDYINDPANLYQIIPLSIGASSVTSKSGDNNAVATQSASLIAKHNELVSQRRDILKSMSDKAPQVERLTLSIQELHPIIQTAMKRDRQSILMKRSNVEREYSKYMGRVGNAPQQERVLTEIGRQREIKQGVYLIMLQKREETAMELANVTDKGKLIDGTRMDKNSDKPQKMLVLLGMFIFGVFIPLCVIFIRHIFKKKVEFLSDLNTLTNLPLIGIIPLSEQSEAIRDLRTNLLLGLEDGQKVVLMVSESEGDGKTCLAKRLVDSLTTIGKKALYFNADLRSQSMAKGQHSVDFLASTDFAHQMADAKANNDYVIVDTPALCKYNDAYQIAQFADVTCYVIKPGSTSKSAIEKLEKDSRLPNVKFIINAIDMSKKKFKYLYKNLAFVLISLFVFSSCMSTKNITYFQNKDDINLVASKQLYDAKIMPKDILQIQVFSMTPGASESFNLLKNISASTSTTTTTNQNSVYNYLVSNDGTIVMPIIGTVKVGGLSKNEAESLIKSKILPYMSESENVVVHVRMMNYKYAVLGGVRKPGLYTTQNEKVSILEAIAQAGDLTTFAYRDRIFLIREYSDGQKEYHQLNINDANIISSPYYYLQQNDVIYVESRKTEARNAFISSNTSIWITLASSLMSIATFIIALSK